MECCCGCEWCITGVNNWHDIDERNCKHMHKKGTVKLQCTPTDRVQSQHKYFGKA